MIFEEELLRLLYNAGNGDTTVDLSMLCDEAYWKIKELCKEIERLKDGEKY